MTFPTIKELSEDIWAHVKQLRAWGICNGQTDEDFSDIRLQVYPDGAWILRTGDSQYDSDHRGYWGSSAVNARTLRRECRAIAYDLIQQAKDHCGED